MKNFYDVASTLPGQAPTPQVEDMLAQASQRRLTGDLEGAQSLCQRVLSMHPQEDRAMVMLGMICLQRGQSIEARKHFESALQWSSGSAWTHFLLGHTYLGEKDFSRANNCFQAALAIDPNFGSAHNGRGVALALQGHVGEATKCFFRAVTADPNLGDARTNLASLLAQQGRTAEAVEHLVQAIGRNNRDSRAYELLCRLRLPSQRERVARALEQRGGLDNLQNSKPVVMFVATRWHNGYPQHGVATTWHIFSSLAAYDMAETSRFSFDEFFHKNREPGDPWLIEEVARRRPNLIVLDWFNGSPLNPQLETLRIIREQMGVKIVAFWWDMVWDLHIANAERLTPYVDCHITMDTCDYLGKVSAPEKYLTMWGPPDKLLFHDPGRQRDIPISFVGRLKKTGRVEKLEALRQSGIEVFHTGGQTEDPITIKQVADIYQRSRIVLNFSSSPSGIPQLVGRVLESMMCGAMLLEEDNPETKSIMVPERDYVPYHDVRDLVDKARYYLTHLEKSAWIAANGNRKASHYYSGLIFWRTLFYHVLKLDKGRL